MDEVPKNFVLNQAIGEGIGKTWPLLEKYGWFGLALLFVCWYFRVVPRVRNKIEGLYQGAAYDMTKIRELDERLKKAREMQAAIAEVENREYLERKRKKDEEARIKAAEDLEKRAVKMGLRPHLGGHRLGGGEGSGSRIRVGDTQGGTVTHED